GEVSGGGGEVGGYATQRCNRGERKTNPSHRCLLQKCPIERCAVRSRLPQRSERCPQLSAEQLRLLPRREVTASIDLVEIDQVAIGTPSPCFRSSIDVVRKYRDGDR